MLWGGLKPIRKYLFIDALILAITSYAVGKFDSKPVEFDGDSWIAFLSKFDAEIIFGAAILITLYEYGLSKRWQLTFVLQLPIMVALFFGKIFSAKLPIFYIQLLSFGCIFMSMVLLILFPAVTLGRIEGKYSERIGVIDFFLPVKITREEDVDLLGQAYNICKDDGSSMMTVRIFYPASTEASQYCTDKKEYMSKTFCDEFIALTNQPPLSSFAFLIYPWRLFKLPAIRNAKPRDNLEDGSRLPVAFYSHGLFGNSVVYTYQAMSLAAEGYVVFLIEHRDGSQILTEREDKTYCRHDKNPAKLWFAGKKADEVKARRKQTEFRAKETIIACEAICNLGKYNSDELETRGVSFVGKLNTDMGILACGHSFGGATALSFAARAPNLCHSVVAHEPATNWMCDFSRFLLFEKDDSYEGGTEVGYDAKFIDERNKISSSNKVHFNDIHKLLLFSSEWQKQGWGECERLNKMKDLALIGSERTCFDVSFIEKTNHSAFSDCCMLLPTWFSRPLGLTDGDPHASAVIIKKRTVDFLRKVFQLGK